MLFCFNRLTNCNNCVGCNVPREAADRTTSATYRRNKSWFSPPNRSMLRLSRCLSRYANTNHSTNSYNTVANNNNKRTREQKNNKTFSVRRYSRWQSTKNYDALPNQIPTRNNKDPNHSKSGTTDS